MREAQAETADVQFIGARLCGSMQNDGRTSKCIGKDLNVVECDAACAADAAQTDAKEFGDGFLCCPARRQRLRSTAAQRCFSRRKDAPDEAVAPALNRPPDPFHCNNVDAGVNHAITYI